MNNTIYKFKISAVFADGASIDDDTKLYTNETNIENEIAATKQWHNDGGKYPTGYMVTYYNSQAEIISQELIND